MTRPAATLLAVSALLLAGCGGKPAAPPAERLVKATVNAGTDVNPAPNGTPQPVAVRIYQLRSPAAFEAAEFFPLFNDDKAVLKDDLVKRDDLLLAPGQSKDAELHPEDATHVVGVFAAFRDFEKLKWHLVTAQIAPHGTTTLTVTTDKAGLAAKLQPPPKPGK